MNTENLSTLKIHKLTQAQYDRELEAGNIDPNALYLTPDEEIDLSQYATIEQVNSKADINHTHTAEQVGARPNTWMPTVADIGAYTKEQVMTAATATLFGLGTEAVPDDVFSMLSRFHAGLGNEYVWEKRDTENQLVGYVNSPDPNAYPPAVFDGCTYNLLGRLGEKARIETGTYTGTGKYGVGNNNSVTLSFVPKAFIVVEGLSLSDHISQCVLIWTGGEYATADFSYDSSNNRNDVTVSGTTISWYNSNKSAYGQMNYSGGKYNYLAIG